jgi:hypothetical protein
MPGQKIQSYHGHGQICNTVKKRLSFFPSPAGLSLTNLSLAGNYSIIPGLGGFDW